MYPEASAGLILPLIQQVLKEIYCIRQALFHPSLHLICIPALGSRRSYPHFTDEECKPQR